MRILQITKYYLPQSGGIESATLDLTEGLNDAGIDSDVLCFSQSSKSTVERGSNYSIFRAGTLLTLFSTSISPSVIRILNKINKDYDIIHVHFPNPMAAIALFFTRPTSKIIVHWHSDIIRQRMVYPFFLAMQNWVLNRADIITGTSEAYVNASIPLKAFAHKTIVIPLGISTTRFRIDQQKERQLKNQYVGKKIVFSLGRLVYYKGFEQLIRAAKYLDEDTVVLVGGEGELKSKLQNLIVDNGLSEKVFLLGRISEEEVASYYNACDVFCLPSNRRSEAFGVVQLEAMYFRKPIVATNIDGSGVSWVNQHNVTGLNVPVNNPLEMAKAINAIIKDDELYRKFSTASHERFLQHFQRDNMINSFIKIYEQLLLKRTSFQNSPNLSLSKGS